MKRIVLLVCLLFPASLYAAFEDVETGARAIALGGAFVAQDDDIAAIFYNPASLVGLKRYEVLASYEKLFHGLADNSAIARNLFAFGTPLVVGERYLGAAGFSWNALALDALYAERKITLGYGYPVGEQLWLGLALNSLSVEYGSDEYTRVNPLFAQGNQQSAFGFDAGLIRKLGTMDLGIAVRNLNEPNVGIKYSNKVDRVISLGLSLRQELARWNAEVSFVNKDFRLKTGAERMVLRRLLKEKVMVRGGVSIGARDYRNIALGFGYREPLYRLDYSFVYPLSGVAETWGSHQLALVFSWGRSVDRESKEGGKEEEAETAGKPGSLTMPIPGIPPKIEVTPEERARAKEMIALAQKDIINGLYRSALENLQQADDLLKTDQELKTSVNKLASIVDISSGIVNSDRRGELLRKAVRKYMDNESDAVTITAYAYQTWPKDAVVSRVREVINRHFPDVALNQKLLPGISIIDQLLQDALDLIRTGRFVHAVATLEKVLLIEPNNITALTRMGSAYWAMGKKDMARSYWRKVLQLDPTNTGILEFMK